jgi:hypothetical protein
MSKNNLPCGLEIRNSSDLEPLFTVQGPWNIGDPVHEQITLISLQNAGLTGADHYKSPDIWEKMRGVIWNDDPECLFFNSNSGRTDDWSWGDKFGLAFIKYKSAARSGTFYSNGSPLLARSHFGDLQCLHAMAAGDGVEPSVTQGEILLWCEFFYTISAGRIDKDTPLSATLGGKMRRWFAGSSLTVGELFKVENIGNVRDRALGALLHLIQDSFSSSHVQRNEQKEIERFYCYTHQDPSRHRECDKMPDGGLDDLPGAKAAIDACTLVLKYASQLWPWRKLKEDLINNVFKLSPNPMKSDPGDFDAQFSLLNNGQLVIAKEFNYSITGTIKDDDDDFSPDEYGYPNWGSPRFITPDGYHLRVDHIMVVDNEVELRCWLTFSMRSDETLCVTGSFEIFEGYKDHREWKDSKSLDKTIARGTSISEGIHLDTIEGGYADLLISISNIEW